MNGLLAAAATLLVSVPATPAQGFQPQIANWVAEDALHPPPADALLFVGSSSIRKWERLQKDFASYDVIQRGFGGATMEDLNEFIDEIVVPYDPYAIVLYSGGNSIVGGSTPAEELEEYVTFVDTVHAQQDQSRAPIPIFFIGITPAPARWSFWTELEEFNALLEAYTQSDPSLHYIDGPTAFLALGAPPPASLFAPDGLHLSQAGYDLWTSVVLPVLATLVPSPRVYQANPLALADGESLLFDFGLNLPPNALPSASPDEHGNHWNNWPGVGQMILAGEHTGNLVTTTGRATGIGLVIAGGFQAGGSANGGLLNPSVALLGELAVESATRDFFACVNLDSPATPGSEFDDVGQLVLNHLDRSLRYDVRLFGSRSSGAAQLTRYTASGHPTSSVSGEVQTSGRGSGTTGTQNDDTLVVLSNVRPNGFGQLFIDIELIDSGMAYLNALEVSAHVPPLPPLPPGQLYRLSPSLRR